MNNPGDILILNGLVLAMDAHGTAISDGGNYRRPDFPGGPPGSVLRHPAKKA
ncbi:MAG: hypothetical protein R2874_09380 [Desulfobacterales bacterium]